MVRGDVGQKPRFPTLCVYGDLERPGNLDKQLFPTVISSTFRFPVVSYQMEAKKANIPNRLTIEQSPIDAFDLGGLLLTGLKFDESVRNKEFSNAIQWMVGLMLGVGDTDIENYCRSLRSFGVVQALYRRRR